MKGNRGGLPRVEQLFQASSTPAQQASRHVGAALVTSQHPLRGLHVSNGRLQQHLSDGVWGGGR